MEPLTDKLSTLPLPVVVSILALLTAVRVSWKGDRSAVFRVLTEIIETIQIAVALVFLIIRPCIVLTFLIPTGSMQPTLDVNDRIIVNRIVYRLAPVQYGDVVVFRAPVAADKKEQEFIKRVIGIAGDHIAIEPGSMNVDGTVLNHTDVRAILLKKNLIDSSSAPILFTKDGLWSGKRKFDIQELRDDQHRHRNFDRGANVLAGIKARRQHLDRHQTDQTNAVAHQGAGGLQHIALSEGAVVVEH